MSAGNAYTTTEGLVPAVQSGALAPLRSSFLKRLVESGEALQKRQDLPEAAFWDVAAFQRMTESSVCVVASGPRQLPLVQGRCFFGDAPGVCEEADGRQRGRLRGFLGLRLAVPARAHPRSEGVVPRGSAGEQRVVRQLPHDGPDPVAPPSRVHRRPVHSKRVVFRGSDDQFRHQGQLREVRHGSLGAGRCREPGHGRGL